MTTHALFAAPVQSNVEVSGNVATDAEKTAFASRNRPEPVAARV
jgi:hypothetical protein